jgi:hypothetical protein
MQADKRPDSANVTGIVNGMTNFVMQMKTADVSVVESLSPLWLRGKQLRGCFAVQWLGEQESLSVLTLQSS